MTTKHKKAYGKPLMMVQEFVPNEYVASCLLQSRTRYDSGTILFDVNGSRRYDQGDIARGTGSNYTGHADSIAAGHFEIIERGRAIEDGGLGYLYVGPGDFNYSHLNDSTDETWLNYYDYTGSNYIPAYYAMIRIYYNQYYTTDPIKMYLAIEDDGTSTITNAS